MSADLSIPPQCKNVYLQSWSSIFYILLASSNILVDGQLPSKLAALYLLGLETSWPDCFLPLPHSYFSLRHLYQPESLRHLLLAGQGSTAGVPYHLSRPHSLLTAQEQQTISHHYISRTSDIVQAKSSHITRDGRVNLSSHT